MQPAPNVIAGGPTAPNHFVVAAAAAKIASPATAAGLLAMYMPFGQPLGLPLQIHAIVERSHAARFIANEAMAGG